MAKRIKDLIKSREEVQLRNAHAAASHAARNFYKNPHNRDRQFKLTYKDFLGKDK